MGEEAIAEIGKFVGHVSALSLAVLVILALAWLLKRLGWPVPTELGGLVEWIAGPDAKRTARVNVELRDRCGCRIDFGPVTPRYLQNGQGGSYKLKDGWFVGC